MQKPTYEEQGLEFRLLKTSPRNREKLLDYFQERNDKLMEREDALEERAAGNLEIDDPGPLDQYEMYWDLFVLLTEGPHDEIDRRDYDEKLGEQVLADFAPQALKTTLVASGFLPPSMIA